jgi:Tfp pilus assembly protein PilE
MKNNHSSGFAIIALLIAVLIVAILSIYLMNKLYFKRSENLKENGLMESDINQSPTLPNAQNQVDAVRKKVNEIQDEHNKKINESLPN